MIVFLYVLVAILSLLVIGIILIQPSKSGGMGAAFGGIGESVFGAQAGSHLTKATVIMTGVFFLLALILASLIGHGYRDDQLRLRRDPSARKRHGSSRRNAEDGCGSGGG